MAWGRAEQVAQELVGLAVRAPVERGRAGLAAGPAGSVLVEQAAALALAAQAPGAPRVAELAAAVQVAAEAEAEEEGAAATNRSGNLFCAHRGTTPVLLFGRALH